MEKKRRIYKKITKLYTRPILQYNNPTVYNKQQRTTQFPHSENLSSPVNLHFAVAAAIAAAAADIRRTFVSDVS